MPAEPSEPAWVGRELDAFDALPVEERLRLLEEIERGGREASEPPASSSGSTHPPATGPKTPPRSSAESRPGTD